MSDTPDEKTVAEKQPDNVSLSAEAESPVTDPAPVSADPVEPAPVAVAATAETATLTSTPPSAALEISPAAPASAQDAAAQKKARLEAQRDRQETMFHLAWLAAAFLFPVAVVVLTSHESDMSTSVFQGLRLGVTSFFIALAILGLGQIDKKLNNSRFDLRTQILVSLLGMMLWLVWVSSGQMVFKAVDESKAGAGSFAGR